MEGTRSNGILVPRQRRADAIARASGRLPPATREHPTAIEQSCDRPARRDRPRRTCRAQARCPRRRSSCAPSAADSACAAASGPPQPAPVELLRPRAAGGTRARPGPRQVGRRRAARPGPSEAGQPNRPAVLDPVPQHPHVLGPAASTHGPGRAGPGGRGDQRRAAAGSSTGPVSLPADGAWVADRATARCARRSPAAALAAAFAAPAGPAAAATNIVSDGGVPAATARSAARASRRTWLVDNSHSFRRPRRGSLLRPAACAGPPRPGR